MTPLDSRDGRAYTANVAGPAALLVAKLHKLGERQSTPGRLVDKDAHDLYRLLAATRTENLAHTLRQLQDDPLPGPTTHQALTCLADLFAAGPDAVGAMMAGRQRRNWIVAVSPLAYSSWEEKRGGSQVGCSARRTASPMAAAPANAATLCP